MLGKPVKYPSGDHDKGVKLWFHRLDRGIKSRNKEKEEWDKNIEFEDMKQWDGVFPEGDQPAVNKVGAWCQTRMAALAFQRPRAVLTPVSAEGYQPIRVPIVDPQTGPTIDPMTGEPEMRVISRHKVAENVLNFILSQPSFGLQHTIRRLIKGGLLSMGVIKVGYRADFDDTPPPKEYKQQVPVDPQTGMPDFSGFALDPITGLPLEDDDGNLIEKGPGLTSETWFVDWVDARKMVFDPEGENDFRQHAWVAYECLRPLEEVKRDRLLKNTKDLSATGWKGEHEDMPPKVDFDHLDPEDKEDAEQVRLYEIIDLDAQRLIVLADGHGQYLRNDPIPEGVDHSPYCFYRPNERVGEWFGRPPVTDLRVVNDEYNKTHRQLLAAIRKTLRKYVYDKQAFGSQNMDQLRDNTDSVFIGVDKAPNGIDKVVWPLPVTSVPGELFAHLQTIEKNFDEVAGQPGEARGVATGKTATQTNVLAGYDTVRQDDQRNLLAACLQETLKKLLDSVQANMTLPMAVAIQGTDGQFFQTQVSRDMILGDYDVSVDIVDMEPTNRELEKARLQDFLVTVGQSPWLLADEAMAEVLLDTYGIRDERARQGIVRQAKLQVAMMMAPAQPQKPGSDAPEDEAQAISQQGGVL